MNLLKWGFPFSQAPPQRSKLLIHRPETHLYLFSSVFLFSGSGFLLSWQYRELIDLGCMGLARVNFFILLAPGMTFFWGFLFVSFLAMVSEICPVVGCLGLCELVIF
ncbi:hypothetical protein I3843_03G221200 [Carya illinoinensis]|uniref:Uncharacterized protein n=1 Tax=Carya illinoinensis TaxID=32201 RepID=A0A922FNV4_CARIL|nr:hypothetical protein I3842_03G226600 [Carya illinoinensis]KAG7989119.1 hypothetical protein I3843_03G221200 [Carya illinoinensis]